MADEQDQTSETDDTTTTGDTDGQDSAREPGRQPDVPPAMKAALRKANKEAETLRLKLKEYEDRDKSEADRLRDAVTVAEKRAADAEAHLLRLEVGAEKGLTPKQSARLVGSSREELEADADELLASFGGKKAAEGKAADGGGPETGQGGGSRRPKEALRPGAAPTTAEAPPDYEAMAARVLARRI